MGPEMGPEMGGDVGCVTMRPHPTCEVCRPLTCTNAICRWGTGRAVSAQFVLIELLRIRRLGVRIPSGAHCVETVKGGLTCGNAGQAASLCPVGAGASQGPWALEWSRPVVSGRLAGVSGRWVGIRLTREPTSVGRRSSAGARWPPDEAARCGAGRERDRRDDLADRKQTGRCVQKRLTRAGGKTVRCKPWVRGPKGPGHTPRPPGPATLG